MTLNSSDEIVEWLCVGSEKKRDILEKPQKT